jgi:hypothetical protein
MSKLRSITFYSLNAFPDLLNIKMAFLIVYVHTEHTIDKSVTLPIFFLVKFILSDPSKKREQIFFFFECNIYIYIY